MFERGKFDDVLSIIVFYGKDEAGKVLQENKISESARSVFGTHFIRTSFIRS
jgi:hypothetical protein